MRRPADGIACAPDATSHVAGRQGQASALATTRPELASEAIRLHAVRPPNVGRGLALIEFSTSPGVYSGITTLRPDGNVTFQTPIVENGAGAITVFRQIVAEEFGIPVERVSVGAIDRGPRGRPGSWWLAHNAAGWKTGYHVVASTAAAFGRCARG